MNHISRGNWCISHPPSLLQSMRLSAAQRESHVKCRSNRVVLRRVVALTINPAVMLSDGSCGGTESWNRSRAEFGALQSITLSSRQRRRVTLLCVRGGLPNDLGDPVARTQNRRLASLLLPINCLSVGRRDGEGRERGHKGPLWNPAPLARE